MFTKSETLTTNYKFDIFSSENEGISFTNTLNYFMDDYSEILNSFQKEETKYFRIKGYLGVELFRKLSDSQKELLNRTVGSIDLGHAPNYHKMSLAEVDHGVL